MESKEVLRKHPIQFRKVRMMIRLLILLVLAGIVVLQWPVLKKLLIITPYIG